MYTFGQLRVGDMFNNMVARLVKVSLSEAIVVMSCDATLIGHRCPVNCGQEVIVLWSSDREINPGSQRASLSDSEKEDRFYRKIEAEIEAENREREAAEFKQSLIDERDALMERRRSIGSRLATMEYTDPEFFLLNVQEDVMGRYTNVLRQRLRLLDKPVKQTV